MGVQKIGASIQLRLRLGRWDHFIRTCVVVMNRLLIRAEFELRFAMSLLCELIQVT